jgi:peptide chain release factor 3
MRQIPIICFINKLDHPGRDPFDLISELEHELGVAAVPMNWPIGGGPTFQGVYDLRSQQVLRFERTAHGQSIAPVTVSGLDDPMLEESIGPTAWNDLREAAELLAGAGAAFDITAFRRGAVIPVYFGSAINNFGVQRFLEALIEFAPPPMARHCRTADGRDSQIDPSSPDFSGFVFKIQANMDKRHRDRLAFLRVCSGAFEKDMSVHHSRLGRDVRMTRPHRLFARERETIEQAYPGDVIGFVNPGLFQIGDTVSAGQPIVFDRIPRFAPEFFATLRAKAVTRQKQFQKGLEQLEEEGVMQLLRMHEGLRSEPILAVVGELQFDVMQSRLESEYNVETTIQRLPFTIARWIDRDADEVSRMNLPTKARIATDASGRTVALFTSAWELEHAQKENPGVEFQTAS